MVPAPQGLPPRFPCWVRAVYSWGGETKRDLGFMEGDLIECLNAGDGSWWTGRLKRDRRMVGSFPSNFVQVLDESFRPTSRSTSPMPSPNPNTHNDVTTPQKAKGKFRKPFQSYSANVSPNPEKDSGSPVGTSPGGVRSHRPFSAMKATPQDQVTSPTALARRQEPAGFIVSPVPRNGGMPRTASPAPMAYHSSRPGSPVQGPYSRGPSPQPMQYYSRAASPTPNWAHQGSSPPPAPPPHRYNPSRAPSPQPMHNVGNAGDGHTPDANSAISASPSQGCTPSPLTNAMKDVMSCIEDMSLSRHDGPAVEEDGEPPSVWSPEAFDEIYAAPSGRGRSNTAIGVRSPQDSGYATGVDNESEKYGSNRNNGSHQLDDYIERMESRLRELHDQGWKQRESDGSDDAEFRPTLPLKDSEYNLRESFQRPRSAFGSRMGSKRLTKRKSAYELGREALSRTFTTKSSDTMATKSSCSTSTTNHTLMSGYSAGAISATSAGSLYRKKFARPRPMSVMDIREGGNGVSFDLRRPQTPLTGVTGVSYHSSHGSVPASPAMGLQGEWDSGNDSAGVLGGLTTPRARKNGFFRKMIESAKTGAATARSTISSSRAPSRASSPQRQSMLPPGVTSIAGGTAAPSRPASSAAREMGLGGAIDWVQVRRDVNRSNSLSKNERGERADRCQMLDIPVMAPVAVLYECAEGDEGLDGLPVSEPTDFSLCNLSLVDKSARFVNNLPAIVTPASLVQGYLCRPYRSDVQRLRAIFTWVSERIAWEEDFEGEISTRRVLQSKSGCTQEIAILVSEMCAAVGIHSEVIHGYLKTPGEALDADMTATPPNHWWNAVIVDGEWRILDCSLASPTNPRRSQYGTMGSHAAESFWFLTRPLEACYSHVPSLPEQQHIVPPIAPEVLLALPCACPSYFRNGVGIVDFNTSLLYLENLELTHLHFMVPDDIECVAEVEVRVFTRDVDGDLFESGEMVKKPALSQAEWFGGRKKFTIKALLPGDEGQGVLKIYAGKRGLMHSIKSNPHALALALPLHHNGQNPPYSFLTRHPTPHAQRHDLYVAQPQCSRLAANNTFVFSVRQHPSSLSGSPNPSAAGSGSAASGGGRSSPNPFARPTSAMSMTSVSASGSNYSHPSNSSASSSSSSSNSANVGMGARYLKPAKLAIQSPSGRILRLTRKTEHAGAGRSDGGDGSEWETIIKVGERGTWRGLVLADRSARWCVFAEWECV